MKTLLAATAAIALFAAAGSASAQMYEPMNPTVTPNTTTTTTQTYRTYQPGDAYQTQGYQTMQGPVQPMQQPTYTSGAIGAPSWMQDDGSSSDYPIHNPGDRSGDPLNAQYQGGIPTAPGHGFPAYPGQE